MNFLNPAALWGFFIIAPLIAIYFLKVRPEKHSTTTFFLWEQLLQENHTAALFRRLRDLLSFLLLLLAFSAVILAMAQPVFTGLDSLTNLVLIVDHSPSMSATNSQGTSRLETAKQTAERIIDNINADQKVILGAANDRVNILVNATSNTKMLLEGTQQVQPDFIPLDVPVLNQLARNQKNLENSRFILLSDGCAQAIQTLSPPFELFKIGSPLDNIGIIAFDLRQLPGESPLLGLYFQLESSYTKPVDVDLILCRDSKDNAVKVCPITVKPGINQPEVFTLEINTSGRWILYIDHQDALEADNVVYGVLPQQQSIRVGLAANSNSLFYQACIEAFKSNANKLLLVDTKPEIILCEGTPQLTADVDKYIILNPRGKSPFWKTTGAPLQLHLPKVTIPGHQAIRFAPVETLTFDGAKQLTLPENAVVIVETPDNIPLIYKTEAAGKSAYILNLDPMKSDFFLSINFPVLIYSIALDLANRESDYTVTFKPGQFVPVPTTENVADTDQTASSLTLPNGQILTVGPDQKPSFDQLGFYSFKHGDKTIDYACSLLSSPDSQLDNAKVKNTSKPIQHSYPVSQALLIAAILLIATECLLYHRRKVG